MVQFTKDQVEQLAPDAASLKAAEKLLKPAKWPLLEYSENAIWGNCQGSGKNPYKTIVDVKSLAFKCSCPSRKFPCKHGLALLLLFANSLQSFSKKEEGQEPDFVTEWLDKRAANAKKKEEKAKEQATKVADPKAQKRRLENRIKKVNEGLESFDLWLTDIARNGLTSLQSRELFSQISRVETSLVDNQVSGLANLIAEHKDKFYEDDPFKFFYHFTKCFSSAFFISQAFQHLEDFSEDFQEDIKDRIGFSKKKEDLYQQTPIEDDFVLLYKSKDLVRNLNCYSFVFWGLKSRSFYYILNFVPTSVGIAQGLTYTNNIVYSGKAYVYKSAGNYKRVIFEENIKETPLDEFVNNQKSQEAENSTNTLTSLFDVADSFDLAFEKYTDQITLNPFTNRFTFVVKNVVFANYAVNGFYRKSLASLQKNIAQNQHLLDSIQASNQCDQDRVDLQQEARNLIAKQLDQELEFLKDKSYKEKVESGSTNSFSERESVWFATDCQGRSIEITNNKTQILYWYLMTHGEPFTAIFDFKDDKLEVMSIIFEDKFIYSN